MGGIVGQVQSYPQLDLVVNSICKFETQYTLYGGKLLFVEKSQLPTIIMITKKIFYSVKLKKSVPTVENSLKTQFSHAFRIRLLRSD